MAHHLKLFQNLQLNYLINYFLLHNMINNKLDPLCIYIKYNANNDFDHISILIIIFLMNTLISLDKPNHLLEIQEGGWIRQICICNDARQAKNFIQNAQKQNKECQAKGQIQDNIAKIQIKNVCTMSKLITEEEKILALKKLLIRFENMCKKNINPSHLLINGFYYLHEANNEIYFYKISNTPTESVQNIQQNKSSEIEIYGIIAYHLYYKQVKQYIQQWSKLAYKNSNFSPKGKKETKIDQFISSILNKQIPSLKAAFHTIEILIEKQNYNQKQKQNREFQNIHYADIMKIDFKNHNQSSARLKQSNSMTNLSSSASKHRKYKKTSNHFKNNTKATKDSMRSTQSFWNTPLYSTTNSRVFKAGTLLASTKKSTTDNWYKQDIRNQSFLNPQSKLKKDQQKNQSVTKEIDLMKLFETKQKPKASERISQKMVATANESILKSTKPMPEQSQIQISKFLMKIQSKNISICIKGTKSNKNMRLCSGLYSLNETITIPKRGQPKIQLQQPQKTSRILQQNKQVINSPNSNYRLTQRTILSENKSSVSIGVPGLKSLQRDKEDTIVEKPIEIAPSLKNKQFLEATFNYVNTVTMKLLHATWIIPVYSLIVYYYIVLERNIEGNGIEIVNKNLAGFKKKIDNLNKTRDNFLSHQKVSDITFITTLDVFQNYTTEEKQEIKQTCLTIMKKQYKKNQEQLTAIRKQSLEIGKLKCLLIFMLRLAICITVIEDSETENAGVNDFDRGESRILNSDEKLQYQVRVLLDQYSKLFDF